MRVTLAPGALLREFRRATERLIGKQAFDADRFVVAVSGGTDSLALMLIANHWFRDRMTVVTVDHGLRPESAAEAAFVARVCGVRSIPHVTLCPPAPIVGSIQAAARLARYTLLEQWRTANDFDWIMTAHHANDQLETMAMRLKRGAGVTGLSGIRARLGRVLRPLLAVSSGQLAHEVALHSLTGVQDPSNLDSRFERIRIRSALAKVKINPITAAASASHLADADEALEWTTRRLWSERVQPSDGIAMRIDTAGLPRELRRRLLRATLATFGGKEARGPSVDFALDLLDGGKSAMLADVRIAPDRRVSTLWHLSPAPPRRTG